MSLRDACFIACAISPWPSVLYSHGPWTSILLKVACFIGCLVSSCCLTHSYRSMDSGPWWSRSAGNACFVACLKFLQVSLPDPSIWGAAPLVASPWKHWPLLKRGDIGVWCKGLMQCLSVSDLADVGSQDSLSNSDMAKSCHSIMAMRMRNIVIFRQDQSYPCGESRSSWWNFSETWQGDWL